MRDLEQRLSRSLATRAHDVRPDPATLERVQARLRRRARIRWSAAGATAAAVLALAALTLPGLLTTTRVDLSPADPSPGLSGTTALVTTDGRHIAVTDTAGEVRREVDPPTDADDPLPIIRLAVRPGSTPDDLTVVYLRADAACERVEVGWVTVNVAGPAGGALGGGQGLCVTDPVWSPDGDAVAWAVEADGSFSLETYSWSEGPDGGSELFDLDIPEVLALRATGWWWDRVRTAGDGEHTGVISVSAVHADGTARAYVVPVARGADGAIRVVSSTWDPVDASGDGAGRSVVIVPSHRGVPGSEGTGDDGYELAVGPAETVVLSRLATDAEPTRLRLPAGVIDAEQVDRGDAWLSAHGDTVVLGAGGDGWIAHRDGEGWGELTELPGVVHADVIGSPATAPETTPVPPAPEGFSFVVTDGEQLTLRRLESPVVLAEAPERDITDFAVHPDSTADDLTVVWREGGWGCGAALHYIRVVDGSRRTGGIQATCPGRPAFAPDGTHLAWVSHSDPDDPDATGPGLETVSWSDGPVGGLVTFGLEPDQPETTSFDLTDWVWTGDGGTATAGMLRMVGYDSHGTPSAYVLHVERQGDNALALPPGANAQEQAGIITVDSHDGDRAGATVGPSYTLEQVPDAGTNTLRIGRAAGGDTDTEWFNLPDGLVRVYGGAAETDNVWMTARGDDVLLGDGAGRAWRLPWRDDGWLDLDELGGQVIYAVPIAPAGQARPDPGADPARCRGPRAACPGAATGDDPPTPDGLPAAVEATRQAILDAAAAGDVDGLAALAGDDFVSSFGAPEEPDAFFTRLRDEGELDRLVRILELPHGASSGGLRAGADEEGGLYSWPFAYTRDLESLSSADLELLGTVATQDEIDQWFAFGAYTGWRAGIDAEGTWQFYVAGD